ncbi:HmuY family protein [Myroides odoratimimus]|uniref:HmuY family protein n=1 Tax=Myroides odoratimimus TaxID=76832 RepID=UPI001CE0C5BF|nr:HmuY family protein [Myroides odoratimimus]MCA4807017.1 HmuY family protein [Myroides odoratimimus]
MKKHLYHFRKTLIAILITISATSCTKYDALPYDGKNLPRLTEYSNDWLYYNLEKDMFLNPFSSGDSLFRTSDRTIVEGEQRERLDWDIAFNRFNIRTNSGLSGNGKAGVYDMGRVPYHTIKSISQIPSNAIFTTDTLVNITMSQEHWILQSSKTGSTDPWFDPNNGPKQIQSTANKVLANALVFSGPPPSYLPSNHIYIIRTADGKRYFKLLVISWYNASIEIDNNGGLISYKCEQLF